jgi:hypothetical protein
MLRVVETVIDRVNGRVVGTAVTEIVLQGDAEYVTEGVIDRV